MTIVPLYVENSYFNITVAKLRIYTIIAIPSLLLAISVLVRRYFIHANVFKLKPWEWCLLISIFIAFLSSVFSGRFLSCFWGNDGWGVGLFVIISSFLIYLLISRCSSYNHNLWLTVIIVFDIIMIIGIMQFCGIDVFSMHKNISSGTYYYYFSTIGNTNRLAGYLCLFLPLLLMFYISSRTIFSNIFFFISLVLCVFASVISSTDSIYLGIGFMLIFALPYLTKNVKYLLKSFYAFSVFGISLLCISVFPRFNNLRIQAGAISSLFYKPAVALAITLLGLLFIVLTKLFGNRFSKKNGRVICILFETVLIGIALFFIIKTLHSFNDEWGSHRGLIWKSSLKTFMRSSIKDKLIGIGPEQLGSIYSDVAKAFGMKTLTAHSEPIQMLLSTGILGFLSYMCTCFFIAFDYLKNSAGKSNKTIFFLPIAAYFAQSLVNSMTVINVAILIVIASLYNISSNTEEIQ